MSLVPVRPKRYRLKRADQSSRGMGDGGAYLAFMNRRVVAQRAVHVTNTNNSIAGANYFGLYHSAIVYVHVGAVAGETWRLVQPYR